MTAFANFADIRVLCVGDVMLDRFVYSTADRLSPEHPVPIIEVAAEELFLGGAANVGRNIVSLGGRCTLVGLVGDDTSGVLLRELIGREARIEPRLIVDSSRPTTEKRRYVVQRRQLLRADRELAMPPDAAIEAELCAAIDAALAECDILVISDYAKGVCTETLLRHAIGQARRRAIPVIVDPKHRDFGRYAGATLIAPNVAELQTAAGCPVAALPDAVRAARDVVRRHAIGAVLLTRAEKGLLLVAGDLPELAIAGREREIFDVAGAGDTVIGTLALAIGVGMSLENAARMANAAGGVVVGKPGTATATREEILRELGEDEANGPTPPSGEMPLSAAVRLCARWRSEGLRVGFTNGCFDILHAGHVRLLEFARSRCDRLVVGLNADASVRRLKGAGRPVNSAQNRGRLLAAMGAVDVVVIFEEDTPLETIQALLPDVLVKGADYRRGDVVGGDLVEAAGGEVLLCDLAEGHSTTSIIARLAGMEAAG
jgi:D-beta-D-heptose 7-phosphate kinase/D-beta-D-heptose 1-phosphate adenosyltransferase